MKNLVQFALISTLLAAGIYGCSAESASEKAAVDARADAADARLDADNANARVAAADAHVKAADARVKAADAGVDAADADARAKATSNPPAKATPARARMVIPSGTTLRVVLIDGLSSETSSAGDRFLASLSESVVVNGATVLQKGTNVRGRVVEAEGAGRVKGLASIRLTLTDIVQGNKMIAITTETFAATAESTQARDAGVVAGGAGVGAIIGAITGGKKGAGVGAVVGGGGGTGVVLATKGKEINYGPETRLNFTLTDPVEM